MCGFLNVFNEHSCVYVSVLYYGYLNTNSLIGRYVPTVHCRRMITVLYFNLKIDINKTFFCSNLIKMVQLECFYHSRGVLVISLCLSCPCLTIIVPCHSKYLSKIINLDQPAFLYETTILRDNGEMCVKNIF